MESVAAAGIQRIMKQKKLVQAQIAERSGFTPQQFSDMLHGRKRILADHLPVIAAEMGVEPGEIFSENAENGILSHGYERIIVQDLTDKRELAVISEELVTTASDNIVVRLVPREDQCSLSLGGQGSLP